MKSKTTISAKIVADSKNTFGERITTMIITFPRFILAELNTHRMFSRNSASSRAIPFEKMLASVENDPFIPITWQKDHKGMQGTEYLDNEHAILAVQNWLVARDKAVDQAMLLSSRDITKQLCNRLLEPFMYHTVIVTASEWENFFALRCPQYTIRELHNGEERNKLIYRSKKDVLKEHLDIGLQLTDPRWFLINEGQAEIHMMALAEAMWDAYNESTPKQLRAGEWHIPFGDDINSFSFTKFKEELWKNKQPINGHNELIIKVATAMCARVSYTVVGEEGKEPNYENDIKLHDRLSQSGHWSPFEHCAKAMNEKEYYGSVNCTNLNGDDINVTIIKDGVLVDSGYVSNKELGWSGNLKGFVQYRKMFNNENITTDGSN